MTVKNQTGLRTALLEKIKTKRSELKTFIDKYDKRSNRFTNIAIVGSVLSAALTAGPALGGKSFSSWISDSFGLSQPIWQLLCFGAMLCSIAATLATNLAKSHDVSTKLMQAQLCDAKLEGLHVQTEMQRVDTQEAADLFSRYITETPFV